MERYEMKLSSARHLSAVGAEKRHGERFVAQHESFHLQGSWGQAGSAADGGAAGGEDPLDSPTGGGNDGQLEAERAQVRP